MGLRGRSGLLGGGHCGVGGLVGSGSFGRTWRAEGARGAEAGRTKLVACGALGEAHAVARRGADEGGAHADARRARGKCGAGMRIGIHGCAGLFLLGRGFGCGCGSFGAGFRLRMGLRLWLFNARLRLRSGGGLCELRRGFDGWARGLDGAGFCGGFAAGGRRAGTGAFGRRCRGSGFGFLCRCRGGGRAGAPASSAGATTSRLFGAAAFAAGIGRGEGAVGLTGNGGIARLRARGGKFSANGYT